MSEDRKIVLKFKTQAARATNNYLELVLAIHNKRNERSLEALLAEQLVMSVAVIWESFITDLLLTYATIDSYKAIRALRDRIIKSTKDRFGSEVSKRIRFSIRGKLGRQRIAALLDPKGWNFSDKNTESLSQRANELLAAQFAIRFTLSSDDTFFLDYLKSLRNYLAHRSRSSKTALKEAIAELKGNSNAFFVGTLSDVGVYLKRKGPDGKTRAVVIVNRLMEIAEKL